MSNASRVLRRSALGYLDWLVKARLRLPPVTKMTKHLGQRLRTLHEAAQAKSLDDEGWRSYRDELQNVVVMAAVLVMAACLGLLWLTDRAGAQPLDIPLIVLACAVAGAHAVLLLSLSSLSQAGRKG